MNKLDTKTCVMILNVMVEGNSMRSISRAIGVPINIVTKLLVEAGEGHAEAYDGGERRD